MLERIALPIVKALGFAMLLCVIAANFAWWLVFTPAVALGDLLFLIFHRKEIP